MPKPCLVHRDARVCSGPGRRARTRLAALLTGLAAGLCLPALAGAKTCEDVQAEIAQRMDDAGLQGYSLQIVPTGAPLAGGRVVGQCSGGARKIVYRRFGGGVATPPVDEQTAPAKPVAAAQPPAVAQQPAAVPAPPPAPRVVLPEPAVLAPSPLPPLPAASVATVPSPDLAPPALSAAALASAARPLSPTPEPVTAGSPPPQAPAPALSPSPAAVPSALPFGVPVGLWAGLVLLLALPPLGWLWHRYRSFDAAGLPRGPRL